MAKIGANLDHLAPFVEGPVISIIPGILNLLQRVTERLFTEACKVVPGSAEARRSEINRKGRHARDAQRAASNVGCASQLTDGTRVGADEAEFEFVNHEGIDCPGVMEVDGLRVNCRGQP